MKTCVCVSGVRKQPTEAPLVLRIGKFGGTPTIVARFPSIAIWSQIDPGWGGEEDYFDPATYVDVAHLPNLRKITIHYMSTEDTDLSALYERDLEVIVDD